MPIIFLGITLFFVILAVLLMLTRIHAVRQLRGASVLMCFFLAGVFLHYPLYAEAAFTSDYLSAEVLFSAIHHTLRMFVLDGELSEIQHFAHSNGGTYATAYSLLAAFVYIISPLLTFGAVLSLFRNISALFRYSTHFFSETCIFSELNERSLTLAESIRRKQPKALVVFTDVYEEGDEVNSELRCAAKKLGAICFKRDIAVLRTSFHEKTNRIRFFVIGTDESENVCQASQLIHQHGENVNMELYLFSNSEESSLLLQSVQTHGMKIRRIDEVGTLITGMLYDTGAELFSHAIPLPNGERLISAVILGLGSYGTELLKTLSWFGQMDSYQLLLTAVDCREDAASTFSFQCPELMSAKCNGTHEVGEAQYTIQIHSSVNAMSEDCVDILKGLPAVTYVFVALGNDRANTECAVLIRERCEHLGLHPQIQVVIHNDFSAIALRNAVNFRGETYDIQCVGSVKERYEESVLLNSDLEQKALARHLLWGSEDTFWRYEFNYRSSVASALHQRVKLQCNIPGADQKPDKRTTEDRDRLRLIEHRRWNAYMRSEGYCYSGSRDKKSRNDLAKIHHDLVPFAMLTEEEKAKDDV